MFSRSASIALLIIGSVGLSACSESSSETGASRTMDVDTARNVDTASEQVDATVDRTAVASSSLSSAASIDGASSAHPKLILTAADVVQLRREWTSVPAFAEAVNRLIVSMDERIAQPLNVPVPRDAGGGYTHEQHKANYKTIYEAGLLYQITREKKYADHAKALFFEYGEMYPGLSEHPEKKEQSPGRLFWQSLNEAVWLLYSIQGYDAVVETLSADERENIEQNVLNPMAIFLSDMAPQTFDKIHNHGTWAAAAVGMTGYVLGNQEYVEKALYGLDKTGKAGFLKQIDLLFSPDGYYNEGPYYQRYALMPFVVFAKAIQTNEPERDIFAYRDGLLLKAVYAAIQLSYNGLFFPINDALPDKGIDTVELVIGTAIAYGFTQDPELLSIAEAQQSIDISTDGFAVAKALHEKKAQVFPYRSMQFSDGAQGDRGALSILRSGSHAGHQALVMKNTSQGLGHGHFDKLSYLFYDNGRMIVTDYGAARFLNIEAKYGGHYLPENNAWAKQTIAHNTLVVDEQSHFDGKLKPAEKVAPEPLFFDLEDDIEIVSAKMDGAYADVSFTRTMAMIPADELEHPIVLDLLRVESEGTHQYDLPLHYRGHIVDTSFPVSAHAVEQKPLGKNNGYQYLWLTAEAKPEPAFNQVTWLLENRFYTYSIYSETPQSLLFTRLGANDPNFNLRPETAIIQRSSSTGPRSFVSLIEVHGEYNPTLEFTRKSHSQVTDLKAVTQGDMQAVSFTTKAGITRTLFLAYTGNEDSEHTFQWKGEERTWRGPHFLFEGE